MAKRSASSAQFDINGGAKMCRLEIPQLTISKLFSENPIEFLRNHKDLIDDRSTLETILGKLNTLCKKHSEADDSVLLKLIIPYLMHYPLDTGQRIGLLSSVIRKRVKLQWAESLFVLRPCIECFKCWVSNDVILTEKILTKIIIESTLSKVVQICDVQPPLSFCFAEYPRVLWISTYLCNEFFPPNRCDKWLSPVQHERIFCWNAFFASELLCSGVGSAVLDNNYLSILPMGLRQGKLVGHILYAQLGRFVWHKISRIEKLLEGIPKRVACRINFAAGMRAPLNGFKCSIPVPLGAEAFSCADEQDDLGHYYWITRQVQYYTSELRELVEWQGETEFTEFIKLMRARYGNDY